MANKQWAYGQDPITGLNRRLTLVGHHFIEPEFGGKISVFLAEELETPNGWIRNKSADYQIEQGKISTYVDGEPLPKKDIQGNIEYEEDGVTPKPRDNAYDNIIYYVDNKVMSIDELIDSGVVERFRLL